jgi:hypothetical protein
VTSGDKQVTRQKEEEKRENIVVRVPCHNSKAAPLPPTGIGWSRSVGGSSTALNVHFISIINIILLHLLYAKQHLHLQQALVEAGVFVEAPLPWMYSLFPW